MGEQKQSLAEKLMVKAEEIVSRYLSERRAGERGVLLSDRRVIHDLAALLVESAPDMPQQFLISLAARLRQMQEELAVLDEGEPRGVLFSGHLDAQIALLDDLVYLQLNPDEACLDIGLLEVVRGQLVDLVSENEESQQLTDLISKMQRFLAICVLKLDRERFVDFASQLTLAELEIGFRVVWDRVLPPSQFPAIGFVSGISSMAVAFSAVLVLADSPLSGD